MGEKEIKVTINTHIYLPVFLNETFSTGTVSSKTLITISHILLILSQNISHDFESYQHDVP